MKLVSETAVHERLICVLDTPVAVNPVGGIGTICRARLATPLGVPLESVALARVVKFPDPVGVPDISPPGTVVIPVTPENVHV
jgi:hypothetical protein